MLKLNALRAGGACVEMPHRLEKELCLFKPGGKAGAASAKHGQSNAKSRKGAGLIKTRPFAYLQASKLLHTMCWFWQKI